MIALLLLLQASCADLRECSAGGRLMVNVNWGFPGLTDSVRTWGGRMEVARRLGFAGARVNLAWSVVERTRGAFDWSETDSVVDAVRSAGLTGIGLVAYTPRWARPARTDDHHRPVLEGSAARGDTAFAQFFAAAVRRYGDVVRYWEVWNEPNSPDFWSHLVEGVNAGPDPEDFAAMFRTVSAAVRRVDSSASLATGGLASFAGRPVLRPDPLNPKRVLQGQTAPAFLRGLLATGVRPGAIALHPYSGLAPGRRRAGESAAVFPDLVLDSAFAAIDAFPGRPEVWVTEWGVQRRPMSSAGAVRAWYGSALCGMLRDPRVRFVALYVLMDQPASRYRYGLVEADGTLTLLGRAWQGAWSDWRCGAKPHGGL